MEFLTVNKNLSSSRYFRLMGLAGIEMLCTIPLGAYVIYLNATAQPIYPWISWADTHLDFSRIEQIPSVWWRMSSPTVLSLELSRWLLVVCAFVFFAFFGFADEARKNYRLAYVSVAKRVGLSTAGTMSTGGSWSVGYVVTLSHSITRFDEQMFLSAQNPRWHTTAARAPYPCSLLNRPNRSATLSLRSPPTSPLASSTSRSTIPRIFHTRQQTLLRIRYQRTRSRARLLMDRLFPYQSHLPLQGLNPRTSSRIHLDHYAIRMILSDLRLRKKNSFLAFSIHSLPDCFVVLLAHSLWILDVATLSPSVWIPTTLNYLITICMNSVTFRQCSILRHVGR